tara:strand:- start:1372 stop:1725 length:354 start_codon:yes stop_codon:yes gene_type:complete
MEQSNLEKELRNGLELVLALQLTLELMDEYKLKGLPKKYGNMFRKSLEKGLSESYDRLYNIDPEYTTNAMNKKNELISNIASFNEVDAILFAEFSKKFMDNIDIARKKGVVFFDKLI